MILSNAIKMGTSSPRLPKWFLTLSFSEVKEQLFRRDLLTPLNNDINPEGAKLVEISYRSEVHFRHLGYSLLNLSMTFQALGTRQREKKELVLQFPDTGEVFTRSMAPSWIYPDDPSLPYLSQMIANPNSLRDLPWDKTLDQFLPADEEIQAQRLLYNPNRRVTYLLTSKKTQQRFILKMLRKEDFQAFFKIADDLRKSPLSSKVILPILLAHSTEASLFLYRYIPGLQIKKLEAKKASKIKDLLLDKVVQILKTVHQTGLPTLPTWNPETHENEQLESVWNALRQHHHPIQQAGATLIRPLIDHMIKTFNQQRRPYPFMIHNSFSEKHILYTGEGEKLGVLDWDSAVLGPREKDLGQFLFSFVREPATCRHFIALYKSETGHTIDQKLLNTFLVHRLLLRLMRKGLKRYDLTEHYLDDLKALASLLDVQCG